MTTSQPQQYDIAVIGAGINGAGVARDAAGRGNSVALIESHDIGAATSSASSKLIHGGIRYLENYEFSLVREALQERETLLTVAPHLIRPMAFVMPHVPHLRPVWMIRIGLALYDRIGGRRSLPGSRTVSLTRGQYGVGLKPDFRKGFVYSDCWVDDARLVIANVRDATIRGAQFFERTALVSARAEDGMWQLNLAGPGGSPRTIRARSIVNAAGPWVRDVVDRIHGLETKNSVRLVKGSHIVVPRLYDGDHAYILQNEDRRVVFIIPWERHYCVIGTTDVPVTEDPRGIAIEDAEIQYLTQVATRFSAYPVTAGDVVSTWSGVRPLFDDGDPNPSKVTRDYVLERIDVANAGPVVSVYGGKLTTYRHLAEDVLEKLPEIATAPPWSGTQALPGSDFHWRDRDRVFDAVKTRYSFIDEDTLRVMFRRHGTLLGEVLGDINQLDELGQYFGDTLYEIEARWFLRNEWAHTADDILWRRTKCGLHLSGPQKERFIAWVSQNPGQTM